MKAFITTRLTAIGFTLLLLVSCKKENSTIVKALPRNPVAKAGADTTIVLPVNSIQLSAKGSYDPDGSIVSYRWRRINIPDLGVEGTIENELNPEAKAVDLVPDVYTFVLTVIDNTGLSASDTIVVRVEPIVPDQTSYVVTQVAWSDSCIIKVKNINSFIPPNASFRVYLRSTYQNNTSVWNLVDNTSGGLSYNILNNELRITEKNIDCNFDTSTYDILIDWD
jgi:hypothetical protein